MKIKLTKIHFDGLSAYKYRPFSYCCGGIKADKNIAFANEDFVDFEEEYMDEDYQSIPQFCTTSTKTVTSYEDSWEEAINYPIQYCPHCGEKIEISVKDDVDLSNVYSELSKERKEIWKKCQKTDSKKKEAGLKEKVRELDKKLNWFYELAEYEDTEGETLDRH